MPSPPQADLREWYFSIGWLMAAAIALWFLLTKLGLAIIGAISKRRGGGRLTRYFAIKVDAASFGIRWGLLLALIVVESYLLLETFQYFYRLPEHRHEYINARIHDIRNIGIILICVLTLQRLSRLLTEAVLAHVSRSDHSTVRERELRARTLVGVLQGVISTVLAITGIVLVIWQIDQTRSLAKLVAASAGVIGVIVAFGTQSLMRDFFSGFFILVENHYKIGDRVQIGDRVGTVEHISLRVTTLRDEQGTIHMIPNGEIKIVSNLSQTSASVAADVTVNFAYEPETVIRILDSVASGMAEDEQYARQIIAPPEITGIESLSSVSGATYRVTFRTLPAGQTLVAREYRRRAFQALSQANIQVLPLPPSQKA